VVHQLADINLERLVINIQEHDHGKLISIAYNDGQVEFRDINLNLLPLESSPDRVKRLSQIGFNFNGDPPCLYTTISPRVCCRVIVTAANGTPQLTTAEVSVPLMEVADPAFIDKAKANFVTDLLEAEKNTSVAMGNSMANSDEILIAAQGFLSQLHPQQATGWTHDLLRDFIKETGLIPPLLDPTVVSKPVGHPTMTRLLALLEALGRGDGRPGGRTVSSQVGWLLLHARSYAVALRHSLAGREGGKADFVYKPGMPVTASLLGLETRSYFVMPC